MNVLKETKYTYLEGQAKRSRNRCIAFALVGCVGFILCGLAPESSLAIVLASLASLPSLVGMLYYLGQWSNWRKGMRGEKAVSAILQRLDDSYYLLDDVMLYSRHGNIDHLVLGPNGIFVIETKNYGGTIRYDGGEWYRSSRRRRRRRGMRTMRTRIPDPSTQAKKNATMLRSFVEKHSKGAISEDCISQAHPLVVFTNPQMTLRLAKKPMVPALRVEDLPSFIQRLKTDSPIPDQELKALGELILQKTG